MMKIWNKRQNGSGKKNWNEKWRNKIYKHSLSSRSNTILMKKDIRIKGKMDQVKKSKRNREMKKKMKKWKKIKETTQCRKFKINGLE